MPRPAESDRERSGANGRATPLSLVVCLLALTACETARFEVIYVSVDQDAVGATAGEPGRTWVGLQGRSTPPCPQLVGDVVATVNGASLRVLSEGGEASDPGVRYGFCDAAELDIELAITGGPIRVVIEDAETRVEVEVEWPERHDVWTDDDLALAMREGRDFVVRWVPEDSDTPSLTIDAGSIPQDVELVEASPGTATFRFGGEAPVTEWTVVASTRLERAPTTCVGVATCVVSSRIYRTIASDLSPTAAE